MLFFESDLTVCILAGLLKEYLRELPEPVFSNCLYQMLVDAMGVFLPDDPDGNAKLVFSILDCLPKANRVNILLVIVVEHQHKTQLLMQFCMFTNCKMQGLKIDGSRRGRRIKVCFSYTM